MRKQIAILISAAVITATSALYTVAGTGDSQPPSLTGAPQQAGEQDNGGLSHRQGRNVLRRVLRQLDLTEDQKTAIKAIIRDERATVEPLVRQLKEIRQQLRTVIQQGEFDEARVRELAQQQAQVMAQLFVEKARVRSKIFAILTPEQRDQAKAIFERLRARHHQASDEVKN